MPHIRFKCLDENQASSLSRSLPKDLAIAMDTTEENFSFELMPHSFYSNGKLTSSYPYIEVHWFDRSEESKITSAKILTEQTRALTNAEDIVVVFIPIEKNNYFENGKSF